MSIRLGAIICNTLVCELERKRVKIGKRLAAYAWMRGISGKCQELAPSSRSYQITRKLSTVKV